MPIARCWPWMHATKLVIVGDGPDRERLMQLAKSLDVIFTGSLSGQALSKPMPVRMCLFLQVRLRPLVMWCWRLWPADCL